jgi:transposase
MRDTDLYAQILGIESPWYVAGVEVSKASESITVELDVQKHSQFACPECGRESCTVKDYRQRTWRHLDTCQFKTLVKAPVPRTDCPECGVKTVAPPWALKHGRFTLLFERLVIDLLLEMSTAAVCRRMNITWNEASGVIARAVARGLDRRDLSQLRRIGIDEKSIGKGQKFVTLVYNLETSKVIWIGKDRREETLDRFFRSLPEEVLKQIECITMDMWRPFRKSCRKWIPDADEKTVLDRFHIERELNVAVDTVRKQEHAVLRAEGVHLLDRSKWLWLYHRENLPKDREPRFDELQRQDLKTVQAYAIKENFRHFWDYTYTANARRFFEKWCAWALSCGLEPVVKAAKKLQRHVNRILTYFRLKASNSKAEGINNKIQSVTKKAYGFRNLDRFINAIYFHCGGLALYPL